MNELPEHNESLWILTVSPAIWGAHFLLSYISAAIWCEKLVGQDGSIWGVRLAIAAFTLGALIGIGITGWRGYRRHRLRGDSTPHAEDTPEDRHQFLGFATLLLSGLSAVATLYVALVAVFIERCY